MDLKEALKTVGAFVPTKLTHKLLEVNRPVLKPKAEWADPEIHEFTGEFEKVAYDVWLRKRSSADFMELIATEDRMKMCVAIHRCICEPDGTLVFGSAEEVAGLGDWLYLPLAAAVTEVNFSGPKSSRPTTNSGVNSRSASADGPSKNGKPRSAKKNGRHGSSITASAAP